MNSTDHTRRVRELGWKLDDGGDNFPNLNYWEGPSASAGKLTIGLQHYEGDDTLDVSFDAFRPVPVEDAFAAICRILPEMQRTLIALNNIHATDLPDGYTTSERVMGGELVSTVEDGDIRMSLNIDTSGFSVDEVESLAVELLQICARARRSVTV